MHRFFSDSINLSDKFIFITDAQELHHVIHVLRLKKGDALEVIDGNGILVCGVLEDVSKNQATVFVDKVIQKEPPSRRIILACAIPKHAKFELILEKAAELGVDEIIPMLTDRTEVRLKPDASKIERYQKVVLNACKQSKRLFFPVLRDIMSFDQVVNAYMKQDTLVLLPWLEGERVPFSEILSSRDTYLGTSLQNQNRILVMIGPEGDFTALEAKKAIDKGAVPISLGDTTLKVDTAALAVLATIRLSNWLFK